MIGWDCLRAHLRESMLWRNLVGVRPGVSGVRPGQRGCRRSVEPLGLILISDLWYERRPILKSMGITGMNSRFSTTNWEDYRSWSLGRKNGNISRHAIE
jgi:hypothetical protein